MKDKRDNIIKVACIICIIMAIIAFLVIYYGSRHKEFVYKEHLQENVLTVSDSSSEEYDIAINLQEMTYYIINVEGDIHDMAMQYNSKNPDAYWLVKIKATYNMKDYAKDLAFDSCVRDNIYYIEARKQGLTLTEEEMDLAEDDARRIMKNISSKQMGVSEFTFEVLYNIEEKLYLASKYVNMMAEQGYTIEELELEGSFYEELLAIYNIETNSELWDKIRLGNITITK